MGDSRDGKQLNEAEVGGHGGIIKVGNKIGKAIQGPAELEFYNSLAGRNLPADVMNFFPEFHGTEEREAVTYMMLNDLTAGMEKPCIMDLKMGTSTVGHDAKPEKRAAMEEKDATTTTKELGMRLTGCAVWSKKDQKFVKVGKDVSKNIKKDELYGHIRSFFDSGEGLRKDVIQELLTKVKAIRQWFLDQSVMEFFSSSLLFAYDGAKDSLEGVDVKIIDFAHVFDLKDGAHDEGYIFGLNNLVGYLEKMLAE